MKVLIVASHADDEVLGVGGTVIRHVEQGDDVHLVTVADCRTIRDPSREAAVSDELLESMRRLGIPSANLRFLGFQALEIGVVQLNGVMMSLIGDLKPDVVYTHHPGDIHQDHATVAASVKVACRPIAWAPRRLLFFETPSSSEFGSPFTPTTFVELENEHLKRKLHALEAYASEIREYPHPRSIEGLQSRAQFWGQISGCWLAEAFTLHREAIRGSQRL